MSNYTKTTDFEAKDSLPTGDSGKIIRGAEFETEFDAISTAIATKADTAGPTFTGTLTFETISDGTIGVTAFVDEDDMSSDSATLVPTQQSVKAYVDSVTTELQAQDLDFQADSGGALSIDLDTETMTFTGGTGIDTSGSGNAVTFAIDSTVATLTGTQTLTNKTLTSPDVNTPDIDGGTIDGTVIGGTTAAAGSFTTVSATGNITVDGTVDGRDVATDGTKLDGIEAGATADQTAAEIRTLVESATDSNVFTDADHTKLDGIEAGATGDQTNAEIRAAVEAATDSNVFTDADHSKLDGIEALADVTDTTNVTAAGAVMDSELTNETAVKSLDQGVATTDSPTFAGLTTTADVSFGDNDKAIFGAGSDLQIYHDGSHSYVSDQGTGRLVLNSSGGGVRIEKSPTENMAIFTPDGNCELFYDNSLKLATTSSGIDVTGNVDASLDLLVGGAVAGNAGTRTINVGTAGSVAGGVQIWAGTTQTSFLQFGDDSSISANHYRGYLSYNHSTDTLALGAAGSTKVSVTSTGIDVTGTVTADGLTVDGDAEVQGLKIDAVADVELEFGYANTTHSKIIGDIVTASPTAGQLKFQTSTGGTLYERMRIANNGDVSFYEDTGTTAKLFWDASAESLGIGTSSPSSPLEVAGGSSYPTTKFSRDGGTAATQGYLTTGFSAIGYSGGTGADSYLVSEHGFGFAVNAGTNALVITDGGNVGIGTSSPIYTAASRTTTTINGASTANLSFGIGGTGYANLYVDASSVEFGSQTSANPVKFTIGGTEKMRIDTSGTLLVGTTDSDPSNNSANSSADNGIASFASGEFVSTAYKASANTGSVGYFNRTGTDGAVLEFRKSGTSVGSIGTISGGISIGTGDTGLFFEPVSDEIRPFNTTTNASRDAAIDLGNSTKRFKDLYLSGGAYLGGTGSANKLDDYEEGTWTPSVTAGSISGTSITYTGKYVKVGDMVTFTFDANSTSADIQVSSYVTFGGLPFTLSNDATSTVVTEDIDVFARQGFAQAGGTVLSLSACGSSSGTSDLHVSITAKISA